MSESVFTRFWRFFRGYVTVVVEGFFIEKFTNLCAINDLPIWGLKRYGNTKLVCRTTIKGYKQMRHQSKKCGCRVRLERRCGTPFVVFRYRKRKAFLIGVVLFLAIVKGITSFIWSIEVIKDGCIIEDKLMLTQLEELGVHKGSWKYGLDFAKLVNDVLIKRGDLSWVGFDMSGMKLKVKVVDKVLPPERKAENTACNIIARRDCLIETVNVYQGTGLVRPGDVVQASQILVSAVVEMKNFPEKNEMVHSMAEIKGRMWYEKSKTLKLFQNFENSSIADFAYRIAYDKIKQELSETAEIKDVQKDVKYNEDNTVTVNVMVETLEDVGVEQIIGG